MTEKLRDFAEASKETIKKTINKGKQTLKGAAEMSARKIKNDPEMEDGELTLLQGEAEDEIDINILDADDERPFQSFASQMQGFKDQAKGKKAHSDYTKLNDHAPQESTKKQLEEMSQDLERIKDKEQALDAENKILRAQLFASSQSKKQKSLERASDYHKLAGEQSELTPTKKKTGSEPGHPPQ